MFVTEDDLGAVIYNYQTEQITGGDSSLIEQALMAAEDEVKGYLTENNKREHLDGRLRYDVDTIFAATDTDRNALLLRHTITIAKWYLVEICNADVIYEIAKERYDRATEYLKKLAKGEVNLASLAQLPEDDETSRQPFSFGSRAKFNHEY